MALRVGIIGWGEIAKTHYSKIKKLGAEVSAIVSQKKVLDIDIPVYNSVYDMFPNVDAVTIAVPNYLHTSFCLAAVSAGKPVYVEKPICITEKELNELDDVLPKLKIPVHVGYRLRWNPTVIKLRERINRVKKISCMYNLEMKKLDANKGWTRKYKMSGGSFFTLGVHALDLARWLAGARGEPLVDFSAFTGGIEDTCDFPLHVQLSGILPSGIRIIAGADLRCGTPYSFNIEIDADKGSYPDSILHPPVIDDEDTEFEGLIGHFISAAEQRVWDGDEHKEVIQTHRELLEARRNTNS